MATINRKPGAGFSISTIATLLGGGLLVAAAFLPLYDMDPQKVVAFQQSAALAKHMIDNPADVEGAGWRLDERIHNDDKPYVGERDETKQRLGDPIKDMASVFLLEINVQKVNADFASEFMARSTKAIANPTVWNVFRVSDMAVRNPDRFTPASVWRARFSGLILMLLPALGIICIATPLISRFETGTLLTPIWQAFTFAALLASAGVVSVLLTYGDPLLQVSLGMPGIGPGLGSLCLYLALLPLAGSVLLGLGHRFWWASLMCYVLVLGGVAVWYFMSNTGGTSSPAVLLELRSGLFHV